MDEVIKEPKNGVDSPSVGYKGEDGKIHCGFCETVVEDYGVICKECGKFVGSY